MCVLFRSARVEVCELRQHSDERAGAPAARLQWTVESDQLCVQLYDLLSPLPLRARLPAALPVQTPAAHARGSTDTGLQFSYGDAPNLPRSPVTEIRKCAFIGGK